MVIFEKLADGMVHEIPEYMFLMLWDEMYDGSEEAIIRYADEDVVRPAKYIDSSGRKKVEDILSSQGILPAIIHYANSISLAGKEDIISDDKISLYLKSDFDGLVIELDENPISSLSLTGFLNVEDGVASRLLYMQHAMESLIVTKRVRAGVIPDVTGVISYGKEIRKNIINGIVETPLFGNQAIFENLSKKSHTSEQGISI